MGLLLALLQVACEPGSRRDFASSNTGAHRCGESPGGEPLPCDEGLDPSDVSGSAESGCFSDQTQPCFPGRRSRAGIGACEWGTQRCVIDGDPDAEFASGRWGKCRGAVLPRDEVCNDGVDNNCDGEIDERCDASGRQPRDESPPDQPPNDPLLPCVYSLYIDKKGSQLKETKVQGNIPACAYCCQKTCHADCTGGCGDHGRGKARGQCYKDAFLGGGSGKTVLIDDACVVLATSSPAEHKVCGEIQVRLN